MLLRGPPERIAIAVAKGRDDGGEESESRLQVSPKPASATRIRPSLGLGRLISAGDRRRRAEGSLIRRSGSAEAGARRPITCLWTASYLRCRFLAKRDQQPWPLSWSARP